MRKRSKPFADSKIILPITPMLDMTFQLLFFFIINFHPADLEGQLDMALPSEEITASKDKPDPKSAPEKEKAPDFPSDLTVEVSTQQGENAQGGISALSVQTIDGARKTIQDLAELKKYLIEKRDGLTNKDAIKVYGDAKLRLKYVLEVMDVCRQAGFKNISFVPPKGLGL